MNEQATSFPLTHPTADKQQTLVLQLQLPSAKISVIETKVASLVYTTARTSNLLRHRMGLLHPAGWTLYTRKFELPRSSELTSEQQLLLLSWRLLKQGWQGRELCHTYLQRDQQGHQNLEKQTICADQLRDPQKQI